MNNKVGIHSGYFRGTPYENDLYAMMDAGTKVNADLLELRPKFFYDMSASEKDRFKKSMADHNLELCVCSGCSAAVDISSADLDIQKAGLEFHKKVVKLISEVGGKHWAGINYASWPARRSEVLTMDEKRRFRDRSVANMREIMKFAEDYDVHYSYEVVNRYEHFLMNTAKEGVEYCELVDSPFCGVLLDVFHMNIDEDSICEALLFAQQKKRLSYVHFGESNRRIPGTGKTHIDWNGIFDTLKRGGYIGAITLEPFVLAEIPNSVDVCLWRDLSNNATLDQMLADLKTGVDFVKDALKKRA